LSTLAAGVVIPVEPIAATPPALVTLKVELL
jgi:hypothetical protein